ncbi:MAG: hypothetical protein J07HB67_01796 [halophilic archaeon J07HB67]|nr:MAG: hypothetical protein J07HB67_01796 [halophilic archaeon J07HB67]
MWTNGSRISVRIVRSNSMSRPSISKSTCLSWSRARSRTSRGNVSTTDDNGISRMSITVFWRFEEILSSSSKFSESIPASSISRRSLIRLVTNCSTSPYNSSNCSTSTRIEEMLSELLVVVPPAVSDSSVSSLSVSSVVVSPVASSSAGAVPVDGSSSGDGSSAVTSTAAT